MAESWKVNELCSILTWPIPVSSSQLCVSLRNPQPHSHWKRYEGSPTTQPQRTIAIWPRRWQLYRKVPFIFLRFYLFIWERERMQENKHEGGQEQKKREKWTPCWAGSLIWGAQSQAPGIMTWAEGRHPTKWATQAHLKSPILKLAFAWPNSELTQTFSEEESYTWFCTSSICLSREALEGQFLWGSSGSGCWSWWALYSAVERESIP